MQCTAHLRGTTIRCKKQAMKGKTVCRNHGGATPSGPASPHWKHGRYSKAMPTGLAEAYKKTMTDPTLLTLGKEIGIAQLRITQLTAEEEPNWEEIAFWADVKRKLIQSEARRLNLMEMYVPKAQVMAREALNREIIMRALNFDKEALRRFENEYEIAFANFFGVNVVEARTEAAQIAVALLGAGDDEMEEEGEFDDE